MEIPRKHKRIDHEDATFVKIVRTTNEDTKLNDQAVMCRTLDISMKGVRVALDSELPKGSRVEVWIKSHEGEGTLRLFGKVVWCRTPYAKDGMEAGVQFRKDQDDDYKEYQKRVAKMLLPQA